MFALRGISSLPTPVGYNNTDQSKFTFSVSTFKSLTATEANMKIGEISTNSEGDKSGRYVAGWHPDNDSITFFSSSGKQGNALVYVPQWLVDYNSEWEGWTVGWYDRDDDPEYENCLNDTYPVPFGAGYYVNALSALSSKSPKLVFAGQVKGEVTEVPVYKFTIAGFCRPADGTLANLKTNSQGNKDGQYVTGWHPDNDSINFFSANGKQGNALVHVPQWLVDYNPEWEGWPTGWYDRDDDPEYENPLDSTPISAGDGFYVNALSSISGKNPSLWIEPAITIDAE